MKRLKPDDLERLAFDTGTAIEVDNEQGIAVLTLAHTTYYAALEPSGEAAS